MLLRDNRGALRTVTEVIPAVEKREVFNGEKRCFLERCASTAVKPNAVVFRFDGDDDINSMMISRTKLLIGNLKSEVAESIISDLMKNGVADISGFKFQKKTPIFEMAKFDNGATMPYVMENFNNFSNENIPIGFPIGNRFCGTPAFDDEAEGDDDADLSGYSDEELRRMIYESDDVTITELAAMERAELEEKYFSMGV